MPVAKQQQRGAEERDQGREERGVPEALDSQPRGTAEEEVQGGSAVVVSRASPNMLSVIPTH